MIRSTNNVIEILPSTADDLIFGCLTPANLIAYSRTCRKIYEAVSSFYRRAFRIENTLHKYFTTKEMLRFRELQEITGMIISGSTALEFFDRTQYIDSNLDLYVDHRFRQLIAIWLQSIGYKFIPSSGLRPITLTDALDVESDPAENYPTGILILNFLNSNRHARIQLTTTNASPLELVLRFHSTCVMNLITHDKAYSIFPRATFENRRSLIFVKNGDSAVKSRAVFEGRGWTFVNTSEIQPLHQRSSFAKGIRRLGDSKCWCISLQLEQKQKRTAIVWESNSWKLIFEQNLTPKNVWVLLDNPMILDFSYLVNHRLARQLGKECMELGYDQETGQYTDFFAALMARLSK